MNPNDLFAFDASGTMCLFQMRVDVNVMHLIWSWLITRYDKTGIFQRFPLLSDCEIAFTSQA